jgi:hypothetical protein
MGLSENYDSVYFRESHRNRFAPDDKGACFALPHMEHDCRDKYILSKLILQGILVQVPSPAPFDFRPRQGSFLRIGVLLPMASYANLLPTFTSEDRTRHGNFLDWFG